MGTRGIATFKIKDRSSGALDSAASIFMRFDSYPGGYGRCIVHALTDLNYKPPLPRNAERLIMKLIEGYPTGEYEDEEYLYEFVMVNPPEGVQAAKAEEYIDSIRVTHYKVEEFFGNFNDFAVFVNLED